MRTTLRFLFLLSMTFALISATPAQTKKYDIKSGKVTFHSVTQLGKLKMTTKAIVYFDDYGMKECKETFTNDKLKESFFSDGTTLFTLMHEKKEGYERGAATRGTELKFDWNEVSKNTNKDYKASKLPPVTIAGKSCESFLIDTKQGKNTFAGYKGVTLLMRVENKQMTVETKAVTIEENISIPAEKFAVPAGYARKKM
jgi:hypothetical protein